MKIIFIFMLLLTPLVYAETTFFDNPDDFFIMGSPVTGGVAEVTNKIGCRHDWKCTDWGKCALSGKQTRDCKNVGTCSDSYNPPKTEQDCIYAASEIKEDNITQKKEEKQEEIINVNKTIIYSIISLVILSVIFYLKRDYIKKRIKKG